MYDVIIIGAGISGLYAAYKIKKQHPDIKYIILEKNPRKEIGGRVATEMFYDVRISLGAGIGRKDKNPLLLSLCADLGIELKPSHKAAIDYAPSVRDSLDQNPRTFYLNTIKDLRRVYRSDPEKARKLTFRQFATKVLGAAQYNTFVIVSGYSDYENADVYETLYNYSLDDNASGWPQVVIPWSDLINALVHAVGPTNIRASTEVQTITAIEHGFKLHTKSGGETTGHQVVVATTIDATKRLIPKDVYDNIHGQPFLRVYAKFDKRSAEILRKYIHSYTAVTGPLQKIIPISPDKGVYMIAYSDNASALQLRSTSKERFASMVEEALEIPSDTNLRILGIREIFWNTGTHYFGPLPSRYKNRREFLQEAQHPMSGITVIGEAVSTYQGWVEGALESVHQTLL